MTDTIRLFVGVSANGEDLESQAVLEYTARKYSSLPIEIEWMKMSRNPNSFWYAGPEQDAWKTETWATPFSGFRWGIPEFCNFKGRAIYMDSDMIIRDDLAKLWNTEIEPGKIVVAKGGAESWRFCVCLWDCKEAGTRLPMVSSFKENPQMHQAMMAAMAMNPLVQPFKENWNCVDCENYVDINDKDIKIIHYSSMSHQVHVKHAVARLANEGRKHWFDGKVEPHWRPDLIKLFDDLLVEAEQNGYPISKYLPAEGYGEYVKESQKNYNHAHQWVK